MRKIIVMIIICLIFGSIRVTYAAEPTLKDIGKHWAKDSITNLYNIGIVAGVGNGSFLPDSKVNVDQYLKMIVLAMGSKVSSGDKYWASTYIDKAKELGLIGVDEFTTYNRPMTRLEMAKVTVLAALKAEEAPSNDDDEVLMHNILDAKKVPVDYLQVVQNSYKLGLICGDSAGNFNPNGLLTRAESCAVIDRYMDKNMRIPFKKESGFAIQLNKQYEPIWFVRPDLKEVVKLAYVMEDKATHSKTKGYYTGGYNGDSFIAYMFYISEEMRNTNIYNKNSTLSINTKDNITDRYSATFWAVPETKEKDMEVYREIFKVLFEKDSDKAFSKFESYVNTALSSNNSFVGENIWQVDNFEFNSRTISFMHRKSYTSFEIFITDKGVNPYYNPKLFNK